MTFVDGNVAVILRKFLNFSGSKISRSSVSLYFYFSVKIHTFSVIQNEFPLNISKISVILQKYLVIMEIKCGGGEERNILEISLPENSVNLWKYFENSVNLWKYF